MFNDRIVELNNLHVGLQAIADDVGMYRKTLSKWCKQEGIDINPKSYTRTCEHCNTIYKTTSKASRFCSDKCRVDNSRNRYVNTDVEVECDCCGRYMIVNRIKAKRHRTLRCNDCIELDKLNRLIGMSSNIYYQRCNHCDKEWITKVNRSYKYCSEQCRYRDTHVSIEYTKHCAECNDTFNTSRSNVKFCSTECYKRYSYRVKEYKRRTNMIENGNVNWNISIDRLIKRDGDNCYICNEAINKDVHYNEDDYPNIEHIKPLSKGGTHTWDNVKLAHRKCNLEKGIKDLTNIFSK
ncbi:HNH endonuclease [Mammaliicoccus vitulinus]|uniref:HNH endonuclease n=1 Tax=Mammaliicoccus vitulinus TaxID=71237 RepID=UPI003F959967